jgi:hypothetical protein
LFEVRASVCAFAFSRFSLQKQSLPPLSRLLPMAGVWRRARRLARNFGAREIAGA